MILTFSRSSRCFKYLKPLPIGLWFVRRSYLYSLKNDPRNNRSAISTRSTLHTLLRWRTNGAIRTSSTTEGSFTNSSTIEDAKLLGLGSYFDNEHNAQNLNYAKMSESEFDIAMGPKRVRNLSLEAAIRMMVDRLLIYDDIDKFFLEIKRQRRAQSEGRWEISQPIEKILPKNVNIDVDLLESLDIEQLEELHTEFLSRYNVAPVQRISYYDDILPIQGSMPYYLFKQVPKKINASTPSSSHLLNDELRVHLRTLKPNTVRGICSILMKNTRMPDLNTFHILIRQLSAFRLSRPAHIILDSLMYSELALTPVTFHIILKLAIYSGESRAFMELARTYNLDEVSTISIKLKDNFHPSKMSQPALLKRPWGKLTESHINLGKRFFQSPDQMNDTRIYVGIVEGFSKFKYFDYIDLIIRRMYLQGLQIPIQILTMNLHVATATKDPIRARWSWDRIIELSEQATGYKGDERGFDYESYLAAKIAAEAVGDVGMYMQVVDYFKMALPLTMAQRQVETPLGLESPEYKTLRSRPKLVNLKRLNISDKIGNVGELLFGSALFWKRIKRNLISEGGSYRVDQAKGNDQTQSVQKSDKKGLSSEKITE